MIVPGSLLLAEGGGFDLFHLDSWTNFLWTLVILAVAFPLMWTKVFKPIFLALEERDQKAQDAVTGAEHARRAAEEAKMQCDTQLANVKREGMQIIEQAQTRAEAQGKQMIEEAKTEAGKQLEKAKLEIEREKSKAMMEIREQVVDLTISAAERVISRKITDEDSKRIVKEMIQESVKSS